MTHSKTALCLSVLGALLAFAACSVDTKKLVFDDDAFDDASGKGNLGGASSGGSSTSSGGDTSGTGGAGTGGIVISEPECTTVGEQKCQGKQRLVCTGEQFVPVGAECDFVCADGECTGSCEPGTSECLSQTEQRSCGTDGTWGEATTCTFACVESQNKCGGECTPGSYGCDSSDPDFKTLCNAEGAWEQSDECTVGTCSAGSCTGCNESDTECTVDSKGVRTCSGGTYGSPVDCTDQVCLGGACTGVCRPALGGDPAYKKCAAGAPSTGVQTCQADGTWGTSSPCNYVCKVGNSPGKNDACDPLAICFPGATRCNGAKVQECATDGRSWKDATDCGEKGLVCISIEGKAECGQCTPGDKENPVRRCNMEAIEECSPQGTWTKIDSCKYCYRGECVPGDDGEWPKYCEANTSASGCIDEGNSWNCTFSFKFGHQLTAPNPCPDGQYCPINRCVAKP